MSIKFIFHFGELPFLPRKKFLITTAPVTQKIKTLQNKLIDVKENGVRSPRKSLHVSIMHHIDIPSNDNNIYDDTSLENDEEKQEEIVFTSENDKLLQENNIDQATNYQQFNNIHSNGCSTDISTSSDNPLNNGMFNEQRVQLFSIQHKLDVAEDYVKLLEEELKKARTTIDETNSAVTLLRSALLQKQNETETKQNETKAFIQLLLQQQASLGQTQNQQSQIINSLCNNNSITISSDSLQQQPQT